MKRDRREYNRMYRDKNKSKLDEYYKIYNAKNIEKRRRQALERYYKLRDNPGFKEKKKTYHNSWYKANKEEVLRKHKEYKVRTGYKYSVTREKNKIAIAGRPRPQFCELCGGTDKIVFDHDHKTGKFRGWICTPCNLTLGFARDDVSILRKLAKYLEDNALPK